MSAGSHCNCTKCGKRDYCLPLHGERGGPFCCLICIGKWDAEHNPRRKARRTLIRAMKAYSSVGGSLHGSDFDALKLTAALGGLLYVSGYDDPETEFGDITSELLTAALALTHPDRHPPERQTEAKRVTQELSALKPFVFPAPEPKPPPKPSDASSNHTRREINDPSPPPYPCEDCCDTVPSLYCDACRTRWDKEQEAKREKDRQKQLEKNAAQRSRYAARKRHWADYYARPIACATCSKEFKPKRRDTKYCSAACRQRAYMKRDGKASNSQPLHREEIERIVTGVLTADSANAYSVNELCSHVFPGLWQRPQCASWMVMRCPKDREQLQRKHRDAVVAGAKKVCERLGKDWDWWRSEKRGGTFVFYNRTNLMSYAMARLKTDMFDGRKSEEKLRAQISPGGRDHHLVVEGGAWWKHWREFNKPYVLHEEGRAP
jgi:hypothetical protein